MQIISLFFHYFFLLLLRTWFQLQERTSYFNIWANMDEESLKQISENKFPEEDCVLWWSVKMVEIV